MHRAMAVRRGMVFGLALLAWIRAGRVRGQIITEFPVTSQDASPQEIAAGPDGNLWFTENNSDNIGRITPGGVITEFPIPTSASGPVGIAAGPDGNLWFTEPHGNKIGRITTAGVITEFPVPTTGAGPFEITAGPDGNLWFTEGDSNKIGRITPGGTVAEFHLPAANASPQGITAGPDGNLWFTETVGNIGRITTGGSVMEFPVPTASAFPWAIAAGLDGNLWFTEGIGNKIGRITTAGVFMEFPIPTAGAVPFGITAGPDGNLWFTEFVGNNVGRITMAGTITEYPVPTPSAEPFSITTGSDGDLWFTEQFGNQLGHFAPPATGCMPSSGPAAGGTSVTITAFGFVDGLTLTIGGAAATGISVVSPIELTATTPGRSPGTLNDVEVVKPDGSLSIGKNAWMADFLDVPQSDGFHAFVEKVFRNGITAGCGQGDYCRNNPVTRAQMAVFLLKAEHGPYYTPPSCTGIFADVECTPTPAFAVDWIEQLYFEGITGGCGGGDYCPNNPVTRAQMAVFLLKVEHGSLYAPPACTGIFSDVECAPIPAFAVNWIEQLFHENVTGGCGGGDYCPSNPNTRGQMAVFIVKTFGLQLYGR